MKASLIISGIAALSAGAYATYCDLINPPVPPCAETSPRDLLFLVDGSNSMNRDRFYGEMLDYCLSLYCAFDTSKPNQAGMIVFAQEITVYIPLAQYTQDQWFAQVETVRATKNTATPACCSCCTPTADAFDTAGTELAARGKNAIRIVFTITDGVPSNNNANTGGNPAWWYYNPTKGFNPAVYNMQIVPQRANVLKEAGHRVFLVGVPDVNNVPPDQKYFNGGYASGTNQCVTRQMVTTCQKYYKPPFPIVSLPVDKNSFSTNTWNVQQLITMTVGAVCEVFPTAAPTVSPTKKQTTGPTTRAPTLSPTLKPTQPPTSLAPSLHPTFAPTNIYIDQVDLTFIVDRSRSMMWHDKVCKQIIDDAGTQDSTAPKSNCWELFTQYMLEQADQISKVKAGKLGDRDLGWAASFPGSAHPAKGLRVNIIGFACANHQRTPKMYAFSRDLVGGPITSRQQLADVLETLRTTIVPDGGTCPGLAIEQSIKQLESTLAADYPLQTVILVTDGVFYDMPFPARAVKGLGAYKALRFAVGIAVADTEYSYGLTPEEIATQREQLSTFVGNNPSLFKNLGTDGWAALPQIAEQIAQDLPQYYYQGNPIPRYTWCGWRRIENCQQDNWRYGNCKWPKKSVSQWGCAKV